MTRNGCPPQKPLPPEIEMYREGSATPKSEGGYKVSRVAGFIMAPLIYGAAIPILAIGIPVMLLCMFIGVIDLATQRAFK